MSGYLDPASVPNDDPPRPEPASPSGTPAAGDPEVASKRGQSGPGSSQVGAGIGPRRLYRSMTNRVWAGLCGGLAEHFGWDPSATRVGYAILTIFTGIFPMLVLYVVMAMVVPNGSTGSNPWFGPASYTAGRSSTSEAGAIVLGGLLILAGAIALLDQYFIIDWSWLGPTFVVCLGVLLIAVSLSRRTTVSH